MKNMKKLILIIAVVIGLSSCEKQEFLPKQPYSVEVQPQDTIKYNLDWSSTKLDIHLKDMKPSSIRKMVEKNEVYGEWVSFYNADSTILIEFAYDFDKGITHGTGRINEKPFILNLESSTINICNSYQNVSVVFDLFSGEEDIDS